MMKIYYGLDYRINISVLSVQLIPEYFTGEQNNDIKKILIGEKELQSKVAELGAKITEDYKGKDLLIVCVLKGAVVFASDLMREIKLPLDIDFMAISSYGSNTKSSGVVRILKDLNTGIEGRHVLIVEDIIDSGLTLAYLAENLRSRRPASVEICTILDKRKKKRKFGHQIYRIYRSR